jgi:hypothetical protein
MVGLTRRQRLAINLATGLGQYYTSIDRSDLPKPLKYDRVTGIKE